MVPCVLQRQQQLLECICEKVHMVLLFDHLVLLVVDQLLYAFKVLEIHLLVDLDKALQLSLDPLNVLT